MFTLRYWYLLETEKEHLWRQCDRAWYCYIGWSDSKVPADIINHVTFIRLLIYLDPEKFVLGNGQWKRTIYKSAHFTVSGW